jgi:ABC-type lipoprotein export system ATPase subunit
MNLPGIVFDVFKQRSVDNGQTIITITRDEDYAGNSDQVIELNDCQSLSLNLIKEF